MRRKLSLLIALIGVFGLIGLTPAAQADHYTKSPTKVQVDDTHDAEPTPPTPTVENACTVQGQVNINHGVDADPRHNHYKFESTTISCNGPNANYARSFEVEAAGGTDGPDQLKPGTTTMQHGETDAVGWSHKSCYIDRCTGTNSKGASVNDLYNGTNRNGDGTDCWNCGEIEARSVDADGNPDGEKIADSEDNFVMFKRVANVVVAWGALAGNSGTAVKNPDEVLCFHAQLEFTPTNPTPPEMGPVNQALLTGTAVVWTTTNKDDCGLQQPGKKPGNP